VSAGETVEVPVALLRDLKAWYWALDGAEQLGELNPSKRAAVCRTLSALADLAPPAEWEPSDELVERYFTAGGWRRDHDEQYVVGALKRLYAAGLLAEEWV
jgi:hypothetical protein